jgi:hypothetical protein
MRVIRAIVGSETLDKKVKVGKVSNLKKRRNKREKRLTKRPLLNKAKKTEGRRQPRLNKLDVLPQHLGLYRLYKSVTPYTAKDAALEANCTKNMTYYFAKRHGVTWAKFYNS